jgi:cilia- and flagella-associated protein 52
VGIDITDTFAYCGTRTGDLLEIYIEKATFRKLGPINRIFNGGIQTMICSFPKSLIIGAGDGTIAKIDKKSMKIEQ